MKQTPAQISRKAAPRGEACRPGRTRWNLDRKVLRQDVPAPPRRNLAIDRLNNQFLPDSQISLAPSRNFKLLPASDRVQPQCVAISSPRAQTPPATGHLPAVPTASTSHGAPPGGHAPVPRIPVIKRALKMLSRRLVLAGQCGAPDHLRCEHCLPNHVGGTAGRLPRMLAKGLAPSLPASGRFAFV